jgi:mRNA interferase YafQ
MERPQPIAVVPGAVEQPSSEEQETLAAIVRRRMAERGRKRVGRGGSGSPTRIRSGPLSTDDRGRTDGRDPVVSRLIIRSGAFVRAARRILRKPRAAESLPAALEQLAEDMPHPGPRTHERKGELGGHWACSAGYDRRIASSFVEHEGREAIRLRTAGTHDERVRTAHRAGPRNLIAAAGRPDRDRHRPARAIRPRGPRIATSSSGR